MSIFSNFAGWFGSPPSTNGHGYLNPNLLAKSPFEPDSRKRSVLGWIRDRLGGYPGPVIAQYDRDIRDQIKTEKARAGPSGILLPWFLPYIDDYTQETPQIRQEYRRMLRDPNVKAALLDKLFGVASLELQVHPDGEGPLAKRVADFIKNNLTRRLHGGVRKLVEAPGLAFLIDGYCVCEKVWKPEMKGEWAGKWILRYLKTKDTGNDVIPLTDEFRNIVGIQGLRYNSGEIFSPANFLILQHLSLYEVPTGMSDFRAVYSRYWLLDTVLKLRAIGLEKRSWPILKGTYATQQQKPSLETALANAKSLSWISIPDGAKVEALEIAGQAQGDFAEAVRDLKHDIFLGISGAILQALEGTTSDGRGNSIVHRDTASLFKWYVSTLIQTGLNDEESGLVPDMVDLNFSGAGYPFVTLEAIDPGKLKAMLDLDKGLNSIGLDLSKKQLYEAYSRNMPLDGNDTLKGAPPKPAGGGAPFGNPNALMDQNLFTGQMRPMEDLEQDQDEEVVGEAESAGAGRAPATPFREIGREWQGYLRS
jgi:hypothetical protein